MGRRKTVAELQRQLTYAQARAQYQRPPREDGAATRRQPRTPVSYDSIYSATEKYTVQASAAAIQFFGGLTPLGLTDAAGDPSAPRGFRPATIRAMVADSSPSVVRAVGSNRPYVRYGRGTRGSNTQYTYTAPLSADTSLLLRTRFNTVADSIQASLGGNYGRVWMEPERLPLVESGSGGVV